jgi:hypothetical protein
MLEYCKTNHRKCKEDAEEGWLPTRLIFVGSSAHPVDPRLVTVADRVICTASRLLALSHKWGSTVFSMLTKYCRFSKRIPVEELRSTFRDTIETTSALGYQYVWINSLSIIQNDEKDWQLESATMHHVYRNAACTLAASTAESLKQGLLDVAKPTVKTSFNHLLEPLDAPANVFTIYFDPGRFLLRRLAHSPLLKRGRVVQERYLSRRKIYFGSPLIWECLESLMSDGHPHKVKIQYPLVAQPKIWPSLLQGQANPYRYWTRAVALFSECTLTKREDKLVAMSEIAKTLTPALVSRYFAGVWEAYLPQSLLWRLDRPHSRILHFRDQIRVTSHILVCHGYSNRLALETNQSKSTIVVMGHYNRRAVSLYPSHR